MKSTSDYLKHSMIDLSTGLIFTCKDYDFLVDNNFTKIIIINEGKKGREEILSKEDIVKRIKELYHLYKASSQTNGINEDDVKNLLEKEKLRRREKILNLKNKIDNHGKERRMAELD